MKTTFADILQKTADEPCRRMAAKVPQWAGVEGMRYPTLLCTEQCSGSAAALLKAGEAAALCPTSGFEVADLTAGIGVDSWAFCTAGARVLHNERDCCLSAAARHNFALLGMSGIEFSTVDLTPGTVEPLLSDFFTTPDPSARICYLDPARRSATGSKVFRIQDCTPDILELLPRLFAQARFVMVKLSPMADIDLCISELGACLKRSCTVTEHTESPCRKAICIGSGKECKELLFILDREHKGEPLIQVRDGNFKLSFTRKDEKTSEPTFCEQCDITGKYLFEPGRALAKAGAFRLLSQRFALRKLDVSTQLYCSNEPNPDLADAGKWFKIIETAPFGKAGLKAFSARYPRCEVSARNLPISSDELRARIKAKSGGDIHIFATLVNAQRTLIAAKTE